MQDNDISKKNDDGEMEIDLLELAATLWQQRKKLAVWSACGALIGLVIAFSIPKEYATSVKLAPEITDSKSGGGSLGALASMAGFSVGSSSGADAVYPQLYPDVVSSVPFVTSLFDVEVTTKDDKRKMTVRQYLENETKAPWWNVIMGLPFRIIGALHSQEESEEGKAVDNFQLTVDESNLVETINQCVSATVDTKTSVVTIDVRMQDPLVSAVLADTVVARLQEFVTNYRTNKARHDLEYAVKLNEEAKSNYYEAQQRYADFLDRNQGLAFHSAQTMRDRLENEATLAFNLYNQTAQQVQKSQAKVQENTPVYAI
ncbi:Wzz/FepE/Etk N-terminal domain-containing protein, partial [uncultured Duncaniella sp.]